ncbi:hemolysin family protein [Salinarchaeum sp. IM2453]|uniref:hemolysin family protein n=1 Tax=Salinarchaeum sp. IM2453 TaxID=2862870 RepID=UPI001C833F19|nr:hemolysin family protein [Salinarchaeum sp. IM2453]QZA89312.1 hemolysin family protein [Salinarchaeum sp. IM2453]
MVFEVATAAIGLIELELGRSAILWIGAITLVILLGLSGFFSSSEIAMFSLPAHRVEPLVEEGRKGAKTLKQLKEQPHRLLVTILVGNNIVNIAMSSLATGLLAYYGVGQGASVAIATFGVTAVVLLFGEAAPKSYAVENSESWSLRIARPLKISEYLLLPLVVTFDHLSRYVNKLVGGRSTIESTYVTRSEIKDMITTGERAGVIEEDEREMLQRIFRFNNTIAKEIMTPRLDVTAVSTEDSIDDALATCVQSGHTRLPVYEGSLDNIIGVVIVEDLVRESVYGEREDITLSDLINPTLHVPESKNADELLTEMREQRVQLAIVIDEFGTTEGIVTMEDMVEEIVGEILEGEEPEPIEQIDDQTIIVQGEVNIEEVNEALDIELPEGEEFETIAGFIFNRAGRLVEEGEEIEYDDVSIRVETVENTRIREARIEREGTVAETTE